MPSPASWARTRSSWCRPDEYRIPDRSGTAPGPAGLSRQRHRVSPGPRGGLPAATGTTGGGAWRRALGTRLPRRRADRSGLPRAAGRARLGAEGRPAALSCAEPGRPGEFPQRAAAPPRPGPADAHTGAGRTPGRHRADAVRLAAAGHPAVALGRRPAHRALGRTSAGRAVRPADRAGAGRPVRMGSGARQHPGRWPHPPVRFRLPLPLRPAASVQQRRPRLAGVSSGRTLRDAPAVRLPPAAGTAKRGLGTGRFRAGETHRAGCLPASASRADRPRRKRDGIGLAERPDAWLAQRTGRRSGRAIPAGGLALALAGREGRPQRAELHATDPAAPGLAPG